jgi:hypothetical protein
MEIEALLKEMVETSIPATNSGPTLSIALVPFDFLHALHDPFGVAFKVYGSLTKVASSKCHEVSHDMVFRRF